jgi:Tol biopolymer transport system component
MLRLFLALLCWMPAVAVAQKIGEPLVGTRKVVNAGPGNQSDPHVSDVLVAYTSESGGVSEIRFHDLSSGQDQAIPNGGAYDYVADVSGDTVVFTRVIGGPGSIFTYDVKTQGPAVEVAPQAGSNRRSAVIGHRTVVWEDASFGPELAHREISAFNLDTQSLTRLTNDGVLDRTPAVSTDGSTIVWAKCPVGVACDVWQAVAVPGGFQVQALTGGEGEESQPDTNGQVVVYSSYRIANGVGDRDIYWQPVGGGMEYRLSLPGLEANPSISGSLIAFERQDPSSELPNYDIMLFDLKSETLYRLTDTLQSERLNDISVGQDGLVRVVWSVPESGDDNVLSFIFRLPDNPQCQPRTQAPTAAELEAACQDPGERPLLASLMLERTTGAPQEASSTFQAQGEGLLCVDNGYGGRAASAGWVKLSGASTVEPIEFQKEVPLVARRVSLSAGDTTLSARLASKPGSSARVRLHGSPPVCNERFPGEELIPGQRVVPQLWRPAPSGGEKLDDAGEGGSRLGCGTGGGSLAWLGAGLVAVLLWHTRRVPAPVRRQSRRRAR